MKTAMSRYVLALGLLAAALSAGCSDTVRTGRSPSYLVLMTLSAAPGAEPDELDHTLQSDVLTNGSVFEDPGVATMRVQLKDITSGPITETNFVTLTRYNVVFRRSDGRNAPGIDVPYGFDGAASATITSNINSISFVLVRGQAKLEPPLRNLAAGGQSGAISTIADVTFFGRDQAGNDVSVTGSISVNFADWADPDN
jgi:hypothetical protein